MKDLVIHEADCPALCQEKRNWRGQIVQFECGHNSHVGTCHAPTAAQLAELVKRAEEALRRCGYNHVRLDAALQPFRGKRPTQTDPSIFGNTPRE